MSMEAVKWASNWLNLINVGTPTLKTGECLNGEFFLVNAQIQGKSHVCDPFCDYFFVCLISCLPTITYNFLEMLSMSSFIIFFH